MCVLYHHPTANISSCEIPSLTDRVTRQQGWLHEVFLSYFPVRYAVPMKQVDNQARDGEETSTVFCEMYAVTIMTYVSC